MFISFIRTIHLFIFQLLGIYRSTVIGKINHGKHLYHGIEAHFTLELVLYRIYLNTFFDAHPDLKKVINKFLLDSRNKVENYNDTLKKSIRESYQIRSNFQQLQKEFDENLNNQNKFYKNSMFLFETLLWFICAWQQQLWELHLQSLHCLCPYFFIFNILNYANLTPIYLLQMYQLCNDDLIIWNRCWRGVYCK